MLSGQIRHQFTPPWGRKKVGARNKNPNQEKKNVANSILSAVDIKVTIALLLSFNLIFRKVSKAPSAGYRGGARRFFFPLQAVWSFPGAWLGRFPVSVKDVPTSSSGPAVLSSVYFESDLSHSRQALKQLRGRWRHLHVVEGETES